MTPLADAEARRRIAGEFETTFFVEAAAGTGKTTALVRRIVGLVSAGTARLDRIVAVTFTEKAAGETKLHLRTAIETARSDAGPEERARLDLALEQLELARIGTIHAFCGDLLHERPVEAGTDPLFKVAAEDEAQALADEAFDGWFENILADPPEGIRRLLRRRSERVAPREQLRGAMNSLREHRDFPAPWRRDAFDRDNRIDTLISELAALGSLAADSSWPEDPQARNLVEIERFIVNATRLEPVSGRDSMTGWKPNYAVWPACPAGATVARGRPLSEISHVRRCLNGETKANLDGFVAASDADLAPLVHNALQPPIAEYARLKARAGRLDFLDLLIKTRDLILNDTQVRSELQCRYSHFFIDEFQDTDPLQAEILLLLAADDPSVTDWRSARPVPGKLFLVGDPKQSIYRFRRADIALYEEVKSHLIAAGAELLHLTASFRAPPSIQSFVNEAFSRAMVGGAARRGQAGYVPLEKVRAEIEGRPTLIALPVPRPYSDYGRFAKYRVDESFPQAVAAFVQWLIRESGWTVEENEALTPICPRHIAILFRRFRNYGNDVTRGYVRGGAPHPACARRRAVLSRMRGGDRGPERAIGNRMAG